MLGTITFSDGKPYIIVGGDDVSYTVFYDGANIDCNCKLQKPCWHIAVAKEVCVESAVDDISVKQGNFVATQVAISFKKAGINLKTLIDNYTSRSGRTVILAATQDLRASMLRLVALNIYDAPEAVQVPKKPESKEPEIPVRSFSQCRKITF